MPLLVTLFLALPIAGSLVFSNEKDWGWLLLAIVSLGSSALFLRALLLRSNARIRPILLMAGFGLLAVYQALRLTTYYFQGTGFNTQFFYHLELENGVLAWRAYIPFLAGIIAFLLGAMVLVWWSRRQPLRLQLSSAVLSVALLGSLLLDPDLRDFIAYELDYLAAYTAQQRPVPGPAQLQAQNLDARVLEPPPVVARPGKNLLLIYLESLEATYQNQERFGELLPQLKQTLRGAINFTDMIQTEGTGYTMSGIVASQCGTPMLLEASPNGNDILNNGFLNRVSCLSDILHEAGYEQVYMGGAPLEFAGKGRFLEAHQYDTLMGRRILAQRLPDPQYQTGWGLYDDSLLGFARAEFERLAAFGTPFNLTVLTLDTHHPTGEASASCKPYPLIDNTMLHAVYCADQLLAAFLDDLSHSPAWDNTVVALVSDHYAIRNAAQDFYPPFKERRLMFSLLNAGEPQQVSDPGTLMDIAPTLLDALAVQHNQAFLAGQSLLSGNTGLTEAALTSNERVSLIRQINSRVFTSRDQGLCEDDTLLRQQESVVNLGGVDIALSNVGQRIPDGALGTTHTLVVLWDQAGYLQTTLVLPNEELLSNLYKLRRQRLLLVGSYEALPQMLQKALPPQERAGIVALMGNMLGDMVLLNSHQVDGNLVVETAGCDSLLAALNNKANSMDETAFLGDYCPSLQDSGNRYNPVTGELQLSRVFYDGGWFAARFQTSDDGIITPVSYERLEEDAQAYCYAQVSSTGLLIPALHTGDTVDSLQLQRLPGEDLQFRLN